MPVISCGGMRYQYKWNDVPLGEIPLENQANLEATIHRALELGINHIETARGYGTSEMQLGRILPNLPREKIILQTKVAPQESAEEFLRTFDTSMNHLRMDQVVLLARISFGSKTLGFCDISQNPRLHDSLADTRASPGRCRTEIPPELAPGDVGLATPAAGAEPEIQTTTPDAAGPGALGLAFASLGPMEESAVLGC